MERHSVTSTGGSSPCELDPMYQKILQSLRLATFADQEQFPNAYLDKLARNLRTDFQHELDAWKALLSADNQAGDTPDPYPDPNIKYTFHADIGLLPND